MERDIRIQVGNSVMPAVGLGLWKLYPPQAGNIVRNAIEIGYRHLDSATDYGNEAEVGSGIAAAISDGVCTRDDLWVTSKLWNTDHRQEHVQPAVERTLADLGLDYLDLYLMHFPIALKHVPHDVRYPAEWLFDPNAEDPKMHLANVSIAETWLAMEKLVDQGLVRHIGICNFTSGLLHDLLTYASVRPAVLQVESHPYLTQEPLLRLCREREIAVTAFSPLGALSYVPLNMAKEHDSVLETEAVTSIAQQLDRTPAQVVLRWGIQRGTAIIPKSSSPQRLDENLKLFDFSLDDSQMASISALNQNRRFNDPGAFCQEAFNTFHPIYD